MTAVERRETRARGFWGTWIARAVIVPMLAFAVGLAAAADESAKTKKAKKADPDKKTSTPAKKAPNKKNDAKEEAPTPGLPPRPKRTVTPPTLTSAQLDVLVDAYLVTTKAPPAALTTDIEFVRRVFLDLDGKLPSPQQAEAFQRTTEKDKHAN